MARKKKVKPIPASTSALVRQLQKAAQRKTVQQVFDDLLEVSVCCLSVGRMEAHYLRTIEGYDRADLDELVRAFAVLQQIYFEGVDEAGSWCDPLGETFEELNDRSTMERRGQFFTPAHVTDVMAKLIGVDGGEDRRVLDPACGSGRNLIAHARQDPSVRFRTTYVGVDLDRRCVLMTTINFFMHGMCGYVVHGNSLSMEVFSGFRVYMPETGLGVRPLTADEARQAIQGP